VTWDFVLGQFATQFGLWWVIVPGILLGIVVGALPGFSAQNTLIMLLPLTLAVPAPTALAFMIALYCATHLAGGIPAILVKIPGTGGAAATTIDGYPMTQKGQAQQALVLCFTASVFGGLISTVVTIGLLPWLSKVGLYLRSVEMVVVMLFGLTLIAVIAAKDLLKGLIAGFFGLLIGVIGTDHIYNTPRATFGFLELYDGVPLVPALIGLFAISEALVMIEEFEILVTRPVNVSFGNASIVISAESARWMRTTSVSSTSIVTWITDRSEIVMSRPVSREKVPGTATSPSSTASRVIRPLIGAMMVVLRNRSWASRSAARAWSTCRSADSRFAIATARCVSACSSASWETSCGFCARMSRART